MYKKIFVYLVILLFLSFGLIYTASAEVIVEDAADVLEINLEPDQFPDIPTIIITEYASNIDVKDLVSSDELLSQVRMVQSLIIVEYADDIMLVGFEKPGIVTLLKNPTNVSAIAYNGRVEFSWPSVSPSWNVKEYKIYVSETDFLSVDGMTPTKSVTDTTASVTGLINGVTYYFAVTAVNVNDEERKDVITVSAMPYEDIEGPEITDVTFNGSQLVDSSVLTNSGTFTAQASDPSGVSRVELWFNESLHCTDYSGEPLYSCFWDIYSVDDGNYNFTITAFDTLGNNSSVNYTLVVALNPPSTPTITHPSTGITINSPQITVSGTAEANTEIILYNNSTQAGGPAPVTNGSFSLSFELTEGENRIQAAAQNRGGISPLSAEVVVTLDTSIPDPPSNLAASSKPGGVVQLTWRGSDDSEIQGYNLYRSLSDFSSPTEAEKVNTNLITGTSFDDLPSSDGTYVYRASAVNTIGTKSALSASATGISDRILPKALSITYTPEGNFDPATGRMAPGLVNLELVVSEPLVAIPFLTITPEQGLPLSVELLQKSGSDTEYTGHFVIAETTPTATAYAVFSGRDRVGNRGTDIESGSSIKIDTEGPAVTRITLEPEQPIKNDSATPAQVTVTLGLDSLMKPGEIPELSYKLSGDTGDPIDLPLLSQVTPQAGESQAWQATFTLPADAGQSEAESLHFIYRGIDDLDNVSTDISAENLFQVYQGDLPPLDAPTGLKGQSLPGGKIKLTWNEVSEAVNYQLYRKAPGESELTVYERPGAVTEFIDAPVDEGLYAYAVSSVRFENNQEAVSGMSGSVEVMSDSTVPDAPQNLVLQLTGSGIMAQWQAVTDSDPITYSLYRSDEAEITSIEGLMLIIEGITGTIAVDSKPSPTEHSYVVTAFDKAGNESLPSNSFYLNFDLLPVSSLQVVQNGDEEPAISWTHPNNNIQGFNIYLSAGSETVKLNDTLISGNSYTDTGYSFDERQYTVTAVDDNDVESIGRSISLPIVEASLNPGSQIKRNIMNRLEYEVGNRSQSAVEHVRLKVTVGGYDHFSEEFTLDAGDSQVIPVVVGGYPELEDLVTMTTAVDITPEDGEKVEIIRSSEIEAGDGTLIMGIVNEEFTRGGLGKVQFTVENTSDEEIEIITSSGSGSDITIELEDEDSNILSAVAYVQKLGNGVITLSNGVTVARIPAGETFTSQLAEIPVPSNAPDNVTIRVHIDHVYYHYSKPEQVTMGELNSTRDITLIDTAYYGEIVSVSPEQSAGDEDIVITGRAVERSTGQPLAKVPLNLVISVKGFERTYEVFTDSEGSFSHTFTPLPDEGGLYTVCALHPDLSDRPVQAQFSISTIHITPQLRNISIPENYEKSIDIRVTAGESTTASNLMLVYEEQDQPGSTFPEGLHVTVDSEPVTLESRESAVFTITFWADNDAEKTGTLVFKVKSDETGQDSWGTVMINYQIYESSPVLDFTPRYIETGVAHDDTVTETITLKNKGLEDLHDITLTLIDDNGSPAPDWVILNAEPEQGTLAVGQEREISISFSPHTSVPESLYAFYLRISSSNYPVTDIGLYVAVTQSGIGNVIFKVENMYTATFDQNGDLIQGLQGAQIKIQNELVLSIDQTQTTDSIGEAFFEDLPAGRYRYRVSASNHEDYVGRFWIKPGVTSSESVFLVSELVTVEWEVVETTIEDKYEVILNIVYETDVPVAVVAPEPAAINLPDMEAGDVFTGEITFTNYGLIAAFNVHYELPEDNQYFKYELLSDVPDTIEAKEVVTVAYRVTCLKTPGQDEGSGGGCFKYYKCSLLTYSYECSNGVIIKRKAPVCFFYIRGEDCGDIVPDEGGGIIIGGDGGTGGGTTPKPKPKPKPIVGQKCLPVPPRTPCDDNPCNCDRPGGPPTEPGSIIHLLQREFQLNPIDLSIKVPGGTINIKRWYYGHQWHFEHTRNNLKFERDLLDNSVKAIDMAGVRYEAPSSGDTIYVNGTYSIVEIDGGYRWESKIGVWKEFDASGRMLSHGNRNGVIEKLLYEPGENGQVIGMADRNDNQVVWFEYTDNAIKITDASGRWVEYSFANDLLSSVKRSTEHMAGTFIEERYIYDAQGRIITKVDAQGNEKHITYDAYGNIASDLDQDGVGKFFEFDYYKTRKEYYAMVRTSAGMVKEQWFDEKGETLRIDINGRTIEKTIKDGRDRIITEENGNITRKEYDEWNNLIKVIYPNGSFVTYEYEHTYHRRVKETNERGVVTKYEYDAAGNLIRKIEAFGTADERINEHTYDAHGNMLTITIVGDAKTTEATTVMTYDGFGNMLTLTDPEENLTQFTAHDALGNVLTRIDARGKTWTYKYDELGRHTKMTDPLGHETRYEYDGSGNKVKETDAEGKVTRYEYDERNNLVKVIDAANNETRFEYDSDNNRIRETDQEGKINRYEYDNEGRLVRTIDGNGNEITMQYEAATAEGCSSCRGGAGRYEPSVITYPTFTKRFTYDLRGRKQAEYEVLSDTEEYVTQYEYDPAGNLIKQADKESNPTQYEYDALNRVSKTIDALDGETVYSYDDRDNLIALQDANGNVTRFEYDRNNRKTKEVRPMGEETVYDYDGLGNLISKVDAKNQKTEHVYDDSGRLVETLYYAADDHDTSVKTVTFTYDKVGNLLSYDDGTTSAQYSYDDLYRKLTEDVDYGVFSLGHTYTYYKNGQKQSFTGPDGITYEYRYDGNKQLVEVVIPTVGSITYNAYTWNRPASITLPGGTRREYTYDPLMRVKSIVVKDPGQNSLMDYQYTYDRMNNIMTKSTEHGTYTYGYDNIYQLTAADNPTLPDETFTYDLVGNRLTSADVIGQWDYNVNNELLSYNDFSFDYDDNGNTIQKTVGTEPTTVTNYTYNTENRLTGVEAGSVVASYYYDPFGRRLWKEVAGGRTYFVYADEGLITETDATGTVLTSYGFQPESEWSTDPVFMKQGEAYYFYHNDHLGTPIQMTDESGDVVWSSKYQAFGQVAIGSSVVSNNLRFPGQYFDGESGFYYNWNRYFAPRSGRYGNIDPLGFNGGDDNLYAYARNNPINLIDPHGLEFINANNFWNALTDIFQRQKSAGENKVSDDLMAEEQRRRSSIFNDENNKKNKFKKTPKGSSNWFWKKIFIDPITEIQDLFDWFNNPEEFDQETCQLICKYGGIPTTFGFIPIDPNKADCCCDSGYY